MDNIMNWYSQLNIVDYIPYSPDKKVAEAIKEYEEYSKPEEK